MILVVNAGSSSIKVALFDRALETLATGAVTEIGESATLKLGKTERPCEAPDHMAALSLLMAGLEEAGFAASDLGAVGHRVVHGGATLTAPARIDAEVMAAIEACNPLAPLHNPHNLAAIRALARLAPGLPQFACFDTAFHATNPEVATRYALPASQEAKGIRRYGFHGISFESLTAQLPALLGSSLPERVLALHLGNGASLCAIRKGRSVATTMGYSPLDGQTMGTRTGAIDGNAVLRIAADHGIEGAARILNRESGLLGLGGASDMRALHAAGTDVARFAIAHFCYWAVRHSGSMVAAIGGLDCIAFTAGIGENDAEIRARICEGLGFLGVGIDGEANRAGRTRLDAPDRKWIDLKARPHVRVVIAPAREERHIAAEVLARLENRR